ncbi:MAG: hypothetical protein OYH76_06810 [Defluviicoccus sp.]|nr:hypothetical protein [Defluviicoccus sp.]
MGLKCALRCTPLERARIRERAAGHGMSVSAFLVACALNVEDAGADEPRLALTDAEERLLFDRVAELDRLRRMLFERLPGSDVSVFGALAFIERALGDRGLDG